jgi:hypothetical protein
MEIYVNGIALEVILENEKTMGEVFLALEQDFEEHGATITEVSADGKTIPAEELDTLFAAPVESVHRLDIQTATAADIREMLKHTAIRCESLIKPLEDIPVAFQMSNDAAAMQTINQFADAMSSFYRLIPLVELFSSHFDDILIESDPLPVFAAGLSPVLEDFLDAFGRKDTVLTGDIAEYEISPRIRTLVETLKQL